MTSGERDSFLSAAFPPGSYGSVTPVSSTALRPSNKRGLGHGDGDRVGEKDTESTYGEKDIGNDMDSTYGEKDIFAPFYSFSAAVYQELNCSTYVLGSATMEALKHLVANIPDWLKRLEAFDGQLEQRQKYFASLIELQEFFRLRDAPQPEVAPIATSAAPAAGQPIRTSITLSHCTTNKPGPRNWAGSGGTQATAFRLGHQYQEGGTQLFFEDLVKFVSASRSMMRKAKMAAKVAQIKRLAELERLEESDEEGAEPTPSVADGAIAPRKTTSTAMNDGEAEDKIPSLRLSARRMQRPGMLMAQAALGRSMYSRAGREIRGVYGQGGMGPSGLDALEKDIYDDLDKGLEYIQSMCEHAAHQFLRGSECAEEVGNISSRMVKTKELADGELERVQCEEPDAFKAAEDESRGRSYRPPSMRKNLTSSGSHRSDPNANEAAPDAETAG
ncbi:hypothetical protein B0T26DRAFT_674555 [Lasiosphaeria miniovina]|uniref:Uncharacterized protein n=1 Tax=Lasiosphaeria miniovina TaxID=1954250 RepID=A0AA40E024_9PEZI|nr:uncharacterized protein B0T26DRAFT_674555 [Lasiosphaeria miniovina]KAK0722914.1 hypothetical protein B0T26DRAFT_674555 [Lasiosphaeria miniovina]